MSTGFDDIALAIFTGISPSGAVAVMLLAAWAIFLHGKDPETSLALRRWTALPVAVSWMGFIASATHLGTPANALYAFAKVGTSPLSNEVLAAVIFLGASGVFWLYSYARRQSAAVVYLGGALEIASACAFLYLTAHAYDVPTVVTWDVWYAPASIVAGAIVGGISLACASMAVSGTLTRKAARAFAALFVAALAASAVLALMYSGFIDGATNMVTSRGQAPNAFGQMLPARIVLAVMGVAMQALAPRFSSSRASFMALTLTGTALVLCSAVFARIPFYAAYLSVGF